MNEKKKTIESHAFLRWWEARRKHSPVPSNPYQAYMTDLSLRAEVPESQSEWREKPNRRDLPTIDLPPHIRRRMERAERKPLPRKEARWKRQELARFIEDMAKQEELSTPKLVAKYSRGYLKSRAKSRGRVQNHPYTSGRPALQEFPR